METKEQYDLGNDNNVSSIRRKYGESEGSAQEQTISAWYPNASRTLEDVRRLKPNWDTYGADPIAPDLVDEAHGVLAQIKASAERLGRVLPEPFVAPGSDGTIQFEWKLGDKAFELELSMESGRLRFAYLLCPEKSDQSWEEDEYEGSPVRHPAVKRFLSWI